MRATPSPCPAVLDPGSKAAGRGVDALQSHEPAPGRPFQWAIACAHPVLQFWANCNLVALRGGGSAVSDDLLRESGAWSASTLRPASGDSAAKGSGPGIPAEANGAHAEDAAADVSGVRATTEGGEWRSGRRSSDALVLLRRMRQQMEEEEQIRSQVQQLKSKAQEKIEVLVKALRTQQSPDEVMAGRLGGGATERSRRASGGQAESQGRLEEAPAHEQYLGMGSIMGSTWEDPEELARGLEQRLAALHRENSAVKKSLLSLRHVSPICFENGLGRGGAPLAARAGGDWLILEGDNPWVCESKKSAKPDLT